MPPKRNNVKGAKRKKNKRKAKSPLVVDEQSTRNNKERMSEHSSDCTKRETLRFTDSINQNDSQSINMNQCMSQPVTSPLMSFTPLPYGMTSPQTPVAQYMPPPAN